MKKKIFLTTIFIVMTLLLVLSGCGNKKETLKKPTNVIYNGSFITWDEVTGADGYEVSYNNGKTQVVSTNSYSVKIYKDATLTVKALDSTETYIESEKVIFNIKLLDSPTGFQIRNGILYWNEVAGADGYVVCVDDVETACNTTSFNGLVAGKCSAIKVKAVVNNPPQNTCFYSQYNGDGLEAINILPMPSGIKFHKSTQTVSWNTVSEAKGYVVRVIFNGKEIDNKTISNNINQMTYDYTNDGKYEISVRATGEDDGTMAKDSQYTQPLIITRLGRPKELKAFDGADNNTEIVFSNVDDATSYKVNIDSGEERTEIDNHFSYTFDKSTEQRDRIIEIVASSENNQVLDSLDKAKFTLTQLAMPRNIVMTNSVVKWNIVPNANGYIIVIDGVEKSVLQNQYEVDSLGISEGRHTFKIRARGNGTNIVSSWSTEEHSFKKLPAPKDLIVREKVLSWGTVPGATSYVVELGEVVLQNENVNLYKIKDDEIRTNTNIKIIAKGNGSDILDSDYSQSYLLYKLDIPENITTDNYNLKWNSVDNAQYYIVKFNNIEKRIENTTSYSLNELSAGEYKISLKACGDDSVYFDSEKSSTLVIRKLDAPVARCETDKFAWDKVLNASQYEIAIDGEYITLGKDSRDYTKKFESVGNHVFKVRALGDGIDTVASNWSKELTHEVKALNTISTNAFKLEKDGDNLKVTITNPVANAVGYVVSVGGAEYHIDGIDLVAQIPLDVTGKVMVKVKANGNDFEYVDGNFSDIKTITILSSPDNIKWVDDGDLVYIISWSFVENAESYSVIIKKFGMNGDVLGEINTKLFNTSINLETTGVVKVEVSVVANGDNKTIFDSKTSSATLIKQ